MKAKGNDITRRSAIQFGAVMFPAMVGAAAVPALALASNEPDPIFAAIEDHRHLSAALESVPDDYPDDGPLGDQCGDAFSAFVETTPTTPAGARAKIAYYVHVKRDLGYGDFHYESDLHDFMNSLLVHWEAS